MPALFRTDVKYPQITALATRFQMFASCTLYNSRSHDAQSCILLAAIPFLWEEKLNASCPAGSEPTGQPLLSVKIAMKPQLTQLSKRVWAVVMVRAFKKKKWGDNVYTNNKQAPDFQRVCWVSHYSLIWSDSYSGSSECISDQFEIRLGGGREKEAKQIIM